MTVKLFLHQTLRQFASGKEMVLVDGEKVGECLHDLVRQFPELGPLLLNSDGNVHEFIDVFVNLENAFPDELNKPVQDGDEIHLNIFFAGG